MTAPGSPSPERVVEAKRWFRENPGCLAVMGDSGVSMHRHAAVLVRAALADDAELDGWYLLRRIRDNFDCHEIFVVGEDPPCGKCPTCVATAALAGGPDEPLGVDGPWYLADDGRSFKDARGLYLHWTPAVSRFVLDTVNAALAGARPAPEPATTDTHTEYRVAGSDVVPDPPITSREHAQSIAGWRHVERREVTTTVSPWAPVDEQDGAQA